MIHDYYSVLGVTPLASEDEIKKAYRRLAMAYHPDRNPGDPERAERFKEISEAYGVLGELQKRKEDEQSRPRHHRPSRHDDPLDDIDFSSFFDELWVQFDDETQERSFCPEEMDGCDGRRAFFKRVFAEAPSDVPRNAVYDVFVSRTEALRGTEREVWLQGNPGSKRYVVRVPAGVRIGTLFRLPINNPGTDDEVYLRVRLAEED